MNRIITRTAATAVIGFFVLLLFVGQGCKKDTDCKGIITVLDPNGAPIAGIEVELSCASCNVSDIQTTDGSGKSHHTLKLPAILDIIVNGTATGKVIRLEPGKTNEQEVTYP